VGLKLLYEKTISIRLLFMTDFYENLIFTIIMIVWFIIIIYLTKKRIKVKKKEKTEWSMLDIWAIGFVSCGFMFPILIIVAIAVLFF
jgi:membrane protein insertase Oxa1/YidC/SpoIIIJ|tara:strand:+ start:790 stop:1050 length:261 start_codon:yes stop_codon:yes gene_type:complete